MSQRTPMCGATTAHESVHNPSRIDTDYAIGFTTDPNHYLVSVAYKCQVCGGISIGITIPGTIDHNMRVGIGYLTYVEKTPIAKTVLPKPQRPY